MLSSRLLTLRVILFSLAVLLLVPSLSLAQQTSLYTYPSPSVLWLLGFIALPVIGAYVFVQFLAARGAKYR